MLREMSWRILSLQFPDISEKHVACRITGFLDFHMNQFWIFWRNVLALKPYKLSKLTFARSKIKLDIKKSFSIFYIAPRKHFYLHEFCSECKVSILGITLCKKTRARLFGLEDATQILKDTHCKKDIWIAVVYHEKKINLFGKSCQYFDFLRFL